MGLNPLLGDVVFQKFETKYGPKTSFVTTRDGLLRVTVRDENYVGPPISNVVREGDQFEFLPADGCVKIQIWRKTRKDIRCLCCFVPSNIQTICLLGRV